MGQECKTQQTSLFIHGSSLKQAEQYNSIQTRGQIFCIENPTPFCAFSVVGWYKNILQIR